MIKSNELRIGNWVNGAGVGAGIVRSIGEDVVYVFAKYCYFSFSLKDIEPIPLTPEILEKCGFVDPANNGLGLRLPLDEVDEFCWYKHDNTIRYQTIGSGYTRAMNIQHLHQLQNLLFALTGTELNVKL